MLEFDRIYNSDWYRRNEANRDQESRFNCY